MTGFGGESSTPRLLRTLALWEYWIARPSAQVRTGRAMTADVWRRKRAPHFRRSHILSNAWRSIFPVPVFGSSSVKITSRGYLYGSSLPFT
ncbi:hypothetical protein ACVWY3_005802 [Bradyrhizobium sp. USDA 4486]